MRWLCALAISSLLLPAGAALAQDEEPNLEFFYPVVTRRPVIERELELRTKYEKSGGNRGIETFGSIEYPILPWWQIELEIPVVVNDPQEGPSTAGFGDIELENKFLLWKSVEHRALVAGGFEWRLPSGSMSRGLGGELSVEPFVSAGIALGPFDVLASISYEWIVNGPTPREQELTWNIAVGYPASRWFTPFVELNSVTQTAGVRPEDGPDLIGKVQMYLTPGFNVSPIPGMTFRAGVQLPLTHARQFDYAIHAGLVWEF
jgi:hypothetical protein